MLSSDRERQKVRRLIKHAGIVMFMTLDDHGDHAGRPMLPLLLDNDPQIYFLTHHSSRKVAHVAARPQVGLTISDASGCYLSIVGRASISRDSELVEHLWRPTYRAWFPDGQSDREATVLCVAVDRVDYWEPPRSRITRFFQAARAVMTRRAVETPMKTIDGL
jgi:general stress protein 26